MVKRGWDINDIIGRKVGKLTVIGFSHTTRYRIEKYSRNDHFYRCLCECGTEVVFLRTNILNGHTQSCGCLKKRYREDSPCWGGCGQISGRFWSSIRGKALSRKIPFFITMEDAWKLYQDQQGCCALTGWLISISNSKSQRDQKRTASLDRIDNTKGYTVDNIQWVHKDVNWMKGRFTPARFLEICTAVATQKGAI